VRWGGGGGGGGDPPPDSLLCFALYRKLLIQARISGWSIRYE
jgi:hypothetical protein